MHIRRITTAEGEVGVATQVDNVLDTATREVFDAVNLWGLDEIPQLPIRPADVLGRYEDKGIFGPLGSVRADLIVLPPERGESPADLSDTVGALNLGTGGGMVPGKEGSGMHRTDTIDWLIVLEGSTNVAYPDADGGEYEITITAGDFVTHNGTFHRWHNRSDATCTLLCVAMTTSRTEAKA